MLVANIVLVLNEMVLELEKEALGLLKQADRFQPDQTIRAREAIKVSLGVVA
jgi:hypothetical protein